jgi:RNA polymerase sigma factor (sigma-70 family)
LGYTELARLLFNRARQFCSDIYEDAAQLALEKICSRLDRCREPRAFFTFAVHQLMNAAKSIRGEEGRQPIRFPALEDEEGDLSDIPDDGREPLELLLASELQMRVRGFVDAYLRKHPRAHKQLAALLRKELEGLDDNAIAHVLNVSTTAVPTLRSHARKRLREDLELQQLAIDLGIIPKEREK